MPKREHQPRTELDPTVVSQFAATFLSRNDFYPRQTDTGGYFVVDTPLHIDVISGHLKGVVTIGTYALSPTNEAKWLCFDADTPENWTKLRDMAQNLDAEGITSYLETSRRGGHLWLFTPPTQGKDIRRIGKQLLKEHGIEHVELYPKQDALITGPGSLMRLPLGIHRVTGKRYSFKTVDGKPLAPTIREQIAVLAHPDVVPQTFLDAAIAHIAEEPHSPPPTFTKKEISQGKVSERIKTAAPLVQFVSQYVKLDDRGKGHCPFHDDSHASFQINEELGFWHCYAGCGGGDIIHFWSKMRETHGQDGSFVATITELAQMLLK